MSGPYQPRPAVVMMSLADFTYEGLLEAIFALGAPPPPDEARWILHPDDERLLTAELRRTMPSVLEQDELPETLYGYPLLVADGVPACEIVFGFNWALRL